MCREQIGHLLIELTEMILDHAQFFEGEFQQRGNRMQRRTRLEGIAQLLGGGTQARGRERREGGGIGFAVRQRLQHAAGTDAEQVRHEAGHFDVRFLEERFQPAVELHAVPSDLVLAPHYRPPQPLFHVRHKAQGEFLRDQAFHHRSASGKSFFRPPGPRFDCAWARWTCPQGAARRTRPTSGAPVLFQGFPHWPPVLRGQLHDDFLDLLLDQPVGQRAQIRRRGPDLWRSN